MDWNVVTAWIALAGLAMVGRGYVPLLRMGLSTWAVWVFCGVLLLAAATALRSVFWDIGQSIAGDDWQFVRAFLGGQQFSTVFNVGVISASVVFLKARHLLIPEPERSNWHWWNAWRHPHRMCRLRWLKREEK